MGRVCEFTILDWFHSLLRLHFNPYFYKMLHITLHLIHSADCFVYFKAIYSDFDISDKLVDLTDIANLFFKEQYLLRMKSLYPSLLDYKCKYMQMPCLGKFALSFALSI